MVVKSGRDATNCARRRYKKRRKRSVISNKESAREKKEQREARANGRVTGKLRNLSSSNVCIQNSYNSPSSSHHRFVLSSFALSLSSSFSSSSSRFERYKNQKIHERDIRIEIQKFNICLSPRRAACTSARVRLATICGPWKIKESQSLVSSIERNARAPVPASSPSVAVAF